MSITDKLREWAKTLTHWWYDPVKDEYTYTTGTMPPSIDAIRLDSNIIAIADRIDAEHERRMVERADRYSELRNKMNNCYIELPKDADGEYTNADDEMFWKEDGDSAGRVTAIGVGQRAGWVWTLLDGCNVSVGHEAFRLRHHHAPTVEDVLAEFAAKLIERGELTNGGAQTIAEYAKRLTLAEGEDA